MLRKSYTFELVFEKSYVIKSNNIIHFKKLIESNLSFIGIVGTHFYAIVNNIIICVVGPSTLTAAIIIFSANNAIN
jgi:hypothetical protein